MVRVSTVLVGLFLVLASGQTSAASVDLGRELHAQHSVQVDEVHHPPVDAPIIDPFRPPDQPWLSGNRGIEYDTTVGQVVRASAAGVVSFSGQVGGNLFVTIRHSPELRTTVGFLQTVLVVAGDEVTPGQPIAIAGPATHFSARRNGEYIDPMTLFARGRVVVRLVSRPS